MLARRSAPEPLYAIDGMRFVAALMVMAFHYGTLAGRGPDPRLVGFIPFERLSRPLAGWFWSGAVGVEIFFVISGYVIALSAAGASPRAFVRRRLLRLWPAAWICATLTLVALLGTGYADHAALVLSWSRSLLLLPYGDGIDPSYWTLGVEVMFYAVVAAMLTFAPRQLPVVAIVLGTAGSLSAVSSAFGLSDPRPGRWAELTLLVHGPLFALGMTLQRCHAEGWTRTRRLACGVLVLAALFQIDARAWATPNRLLIESGPGMLWFLLGLAVIALAPRLQPGPGRIRTRRLLAVLGQVTYPLYLLHQTGGTIVIGWLLRRGVPAAPALLATAACAIALATFVTLRLEPVVRHWLAARLLPDLAAPTGRPVRSA